ncbi:hepatitis A virus cellular receptor 2-like [Poeciliopsis prolifica]|uniref:hepatitis A virus cellular receptor 2-like n=1 Tax=Poeciliopsis prolifica TaxID=188132 RepID=UPI002413DFA3|nr:hepatitis A virus cellular receptor 2-like [Poeciliopsis prolifica]
MASLPQLLLLVLVSYVRYSFSDQISIRAKPGQNVVLPCRAADSRPIIVVDWTRDGLGSYRVLLFRSSQFVTDQQDSSFKGRVDLQDRRMQGGDVSLVLRNPTAADRGTYKCRVVHRGADMNSEPDCIINLEVAGESRMITGRGSKAGPSGPSGPSGPLIGLTILLLLLFRD